MNCSFCGDRIDGEPRGHIRAFDPDDRLIGERVCCERDECFDRLLDMAEPCVSDPDEIHIETPAGTIRLIPDGEGVS